MVHRYRNNKQNCRRVKLIFCVCVCTYIYIYILTWFIPRYSDIRSASRCWWALISRPIRTDGVSNWYWQIGTEISVHYQLMQFQHWSRWVSLKNLILLNTKRNANLRAAHCVQDPQNFTHLLDSITLKIAAKVNWISLPRANIRKYACPSYDLNYWK